MLVTKRQSHHKLVSAFSPRNTSAEPIMDQMKLCYDGDERKLITYACFALSDRRETRSSYAKHHENRLGTNNP